MENNLDFDIKVIRFLIGYSDRDQLMEIVSGTGLEVYSRFIITLIIGCSVKATNSKINQCYSKDHKYRTIIEDLMDNRNKIVHAFDGLNIEKPITKNTKNALWSIIENIITYVDLDKELKDEVDKLLKLDYITKSTGGDIKWM